MRGRRLALPTPAPWGGPLQSPFSGAPRADGVALGSRNALVPTTHHWRLDGMKVWGGTTAPKPLSCPNSPSSFLVTGRYSPPLSPEVEPALGSPWPPPPLRSGESNFISSSALQAVVGSSPGPTSATLGAQARAEARGHSHEYIRAGNMGSFLSWAVSTSILSGPLGHSTATRSGKTKTSLAS